MSDKIVIIGAGIAGVQAATSLSTAGYKCILINNESYLPYYRMRLEEVVSGGLPESIAIHPLSWYEERGIELKQGEAVAILANEHKIKLLSGEELEYSSLIISTGARANSFPIKGYEGKIATLRNMADALDLKDRIQESKAIAVIGGGLLGLELASGIAKHFGIRVDVIEGQKYILPNQLDQESSAVLKSYLEALGAAIHEGANISEYSEGALVLANGERIDADLIVQSVGVRSNISIAQETGIKTDRAILVNSYLETDSKDIYALGDAAQMSTKTFSLAMFAREQGVYVAKHLSGENNGEYIPSEPSSVLKVAGIDVAFFGSRDGEKHVFEKEGKRVTCFVSNGILKGVILIGAKELLMKARASIDKAFVEKDFNIIS